MNHINRPSLPALMPEIGFGTYKLTGHAALAAVENALEAGYRHIGVSNFNIQLLQVASSIAPISCNQLEYHPYISQEKMVAYAREHNIFLTAYSPLAKGRVIKAE